VRTDGSFRFAMRLAVSTSHRGKLDIALWRGAMSYGGNHLVRADSRMGELFTGRSVAFAPGIGYLRPPAERRLKLFDGGTCTAYA
jgi:hypothetical protein